MYLSGDVAGVSRIRRPLELLPLHRLRAALQRLQVGETNWDALTHAAEEPMAADELPSLLWCVWQRLSTEQLRLAVSDAWTGVQFPERLLPRWKWLPIYRKVGYHFDRKPAEPPSSIQLWRVAGVKDASMSWMADQERAVWTARQLGVPRVMGGTPCRLRTVTVGPDRLLAHYQQLHYWQDEYVIDPTGLLAKEVSR